jgi:TolB-like protein
MNKLFAELRRRHVFRVAGVYAVAAWLLVQVVIAIKAPLGLPAWTDAMVIVLFAIGFPIALILAWAFELTPDGVKLTANVHEGESIAAPSGHKLDYAILGGVALIVALFVAQRVMPPAATRLPASGATPDALDTTESQGAHAVSAAAGEAPGSSNTSAGSQPIPPASIAVLPFTDLSAEKDQEYFSDGVAEEILNVLARTDGLKVASRTSSFQFRGQSVGAPAIAKELGVRHLLEGSVRKAGATIRITAQLIDAQTDAHLWSDDFDRPLTAENVFAIQDDIAKAIVGALHDKLHVDLGEAMPAPVRTTDVDAYALYLKGRALFQARRDLNEADQLMEQAIAIDAQFADALAIRAAIRQFGGEYGADFGDPHEARATGRAFAKEALAANGSNSLALAVNALTDLYDHMEGTGAERYENIFASFDRALAADPTNSNALNWMGIAYSFVGDNEEAASVHRRCVAADPALAPCRSNLAVDLISLGRKDEARAVVDAAVDFGAFALGPGQLIILAELKRRDAFLFMSVNLTALRGWRKFDALYDAMSSPAENPSLAAELKTLLVQNNASPRVHVLLNALGDYEDPLLITAHWTDVMSGYRQSPQFKQHTRASGLPDYWRKHGFPPQCRPVGADDFACE